ncbi:MAG: ArnT family glycosyltransferase [Isosphaeraceae bacterium]
MLDLGFLLGLAAWSAGLGLWLLRRFGTRPDHPADALGLALALGLGALGLAVLGLGLVGALDARGLRVTLTAGTLIGAPSLARWLVTAWRREGDRDSSFEWPDRAFAVWTALAIVGTLVAALAPVTDGDALCYHLQVPRRFLERGVTFFDPDLHETVYPLLTELLYAVALALRGPVACRLIQWLLGLVFALNVSALARPFLGGRAWWAGAIALLVPAVSNGMTAPLNDVALAAFGTAALVAWSRFRDRPTFLGATLIGVLTGLAMGVKYPALVLAGLIGLDLGPGMLTRSFLRISTGTAGIPLFGERRSRDALRRLFHRWSEPGEPNATRPRRRFAHVLAFVTAAWIVGGPWYARAFWHTGNPVHPYFRHTFGGAGLDEVLDPETRPLAVTAWNLLTALGPMTLQPDVFDSFSHQFGPVFLLFLPPLLWERPPRRLLPLAAIGYAFLALCLTQRQSMRFVLIALGPLSVAVAWLANAWWRRRSRAGRLLVGALTLVLGFESCLAMAKARHGWRVVAGFESAEAFLSRREPTYLVGRWIDENLPEDARIVGQDHRGFYIPRAYAMELAHRRRTGVGQEGQPAAEVVERLVAEGFTHLLLCPPQPETAVEFDPTLGRTLAPWLDLNVPLFEEDLSDADGVVRRYAMYDLTGARGIATASPSRARR